MNAERLLRLADLLEADAASETGVKFDLAEWAVPSDGPYFPGHKENTRLEVGCTTTACAFGLACVSGLFRDDGLDYELNFSHWNNRVQLLPVLHWLDDEMCTRRSEGEMAGHRLFDIGERAFHYLFMADAYPDEQRTGSAGELAVARRIRALVAGERVVGHASAD